MLVVRLANDAGMAVGRPQSVRRLSLIEGDHARAALREEVRAGASHGAQADDRGVKVCHSEVVETGVDSRWMLAAAALSLLLMASQPRGALDPTGAYDPDGPSRVAEARPSDIGLRLSHGTQDASYVAAIPRHFRRGVQRTRRKSVCAFVSSPPARWASPRRLRSRARWQRSRRTPRSFVRRSLRSGFRSQRNRPVKS